MVNELAGKAAIVTGGASGIGRGIVEKFVTAGARVVIADVERDRGEDLAAALGVDAHFQLTDVAEPEQLGALVAVAVKKFGRLHVMVNDAGISGAMHRRFHRSHRTVRAGDTRDNASRPAAEAGGHARGRRSGCAVLCGRRVAVCHGNGLAGRRRNCRWKGDPALERPQGLNQS
jgi:hypothetical protein